MDGLFSKQIFASMPLLLCGIFLIYLAAVDDSLFNIILDNVEQSRISVTIATIVATTIPMFFAVGFIKKSLFPNWQTIYQYEEFIEKNIFGITTVILLFSIAAIKIIEDGIHVTSILVVAICIAFSMYLIKYIFDAKSRNY